MLTLSHEEGLRLQPPWGAEAWVGVLSGAGCCDPTEVRHLLTSLCTP